MVKNGRFLRKLQKNNKSRLHDKEWLIMSKLVKKPSKLLLERDPIYQDKGVVRLGRATSLKWYCWSSYQVMNMFRKIIF